MWSFMKNSSFNHKAICSANDLKVQLLRPSKTKPEFQALKFDDKNIKDLQRLSRGMETLAVVHCRPYQLLCTLLPRNVVYTVH
jgi:hypothetical protein